MAYLDGTLIASDQTLQSRVLQALDVACHNVQTESITEASLQLHISRARLAAQIKMAIASGNATNWEKTFAIVVGNNATCVSQAQAINGGPLSGTSNIAACTAAIQDGSIDNAIAAVWNDYLNLA